MHSKGKRSEQAEDTRNWAVAISNTGFIAGYAGYYNANDHNWYTRAVVWTIMGIAEQFANLMSLVNECNLAQGISNSLDAKLRNISKALEAANHGERPTACNALSAFVNETQAQSGKALTMNQASQLIEAALQIMVSLRCP